MFKNKIKYLPNVVLPETGYPCIHLLNVQYLVQWLGDRFQKMLFSQPCCRNHFWIEYNVGFQHNSFCIDPNFKYISFLVLFSLRQG